MIKFRLFSKYDYTDEIKNSTDSAILNMEERGGNNSTAILTGAGAILGAAGKYKGSKIAGGTAGALIGAGVGLTAKAIGDANKKADANRHFNRRLREAKRAAKRREKLDWNNRIAKREYYE